MKSMKKHSFKKRPFILLEILIAVALVTLCAIPLIRNPVYFYKKEMKNLEELALLRLENEAVLEIKQKLFKNEIPWDEFSIRDKQETIARTLLPKTFIVKGFKQEEMTVFYRVWTRKEKPCENETICRTLAIEVSINAPFKKDKKYTMHKAFAQKVKYSPSKTDSSI